MNDQIDNFKARVTSLENKSSVNLTVVFIVVTIGMIIGYLLRMH